MTFLAITRGMGTYLPILHSSYDMSLRLMPPSMRPRSELFITTVIYPYTSHSSRSVINNIQHLLDYTPIIKTYFVVPICYIL